MHDTLGDSGRSDAAQATPHRLERRADGLGVRGGFPLERGAGRRPFQDCARAAIMLALLWA